LEALDEHLPDAQAEDAADLSRKLGQFLRRLADHESGKNELVLDAFNIEPGAMD
jgi:hypothetical protein